jgi:hypothetical protein
MPSARPLIVRQIKDNVTALATVRGTANLHAVLQQGWSFPACFVWRKGRKRLSPPGAVKQFETEYVVMIIATIDKDSGDTPDGVESLSDAVASVLDDWQPSGLKTRLNYQTSDIAANLERNLAVCFDVYTIKEFL